MENNKPKILLIGGPTAVGKTSLAIKCAKFFGGEIISCDSIQIYKGLNIGSAKATEEEQQEIRHHLIDILEPNEEFSVAEFRKKAVALIDDITNRGKLPILVGGTGLFMKGIIYPLSFGGENQENTKEIREKYMNLAGEKGNEFVYNILLEKDEVTAKKLHPNDLKRVVRALEIFDSTGKSKTENEITMESPYNYAMVFLDDEREKLYERINLRVDKMFDDGLENEVKSLIEKYNLNENSQSMQAIGYKEFFPYFYGEQTLQEVKDKIKQNTRHYAKRQITFFKAMPNVLRLNCNNQDKIIEIIKQTLKI